MATSHRSGGCAFSKETGDKILTIAESLRQEGERKGKLEGIQEGKLVGIQEGKLLIAKCMLAKKQPLENIMEFTDLTMDQIQALADENDRLDSGS